MRLGRIVVRFGAALLLAVPLVAMRGGAPGLERGGPPGVSAGASSERSTTSRTSSGAGASSHTVLAFGDSVPSGHACGCAPFPQTYGGLLSQRLGVRVSVDNRAVSGLDTAGLVAQLGEQPVQDAVRRSDIIIVMIGANDFGDHHSEVVTGTCATGNSDCVSDEIQALEQHLGSILATLRGLRRGMPTTVLVGGYWNVFQDGDVARSAVGDAGLRASLALTRRANAVIGSVSDAAGADYVNIFAAFQRAGRDVTSLMAPDGDHPNAAGHALIAHTLINAGLPRMR
jgi:lysophospholipase L1-like esterase